jgi:MoxR-like ATPase
MTDPSVPLSRYMPQQAYDPSTSPATAPSGDTGRPAAAFLQVRTEIAKAVVGQHEAVTGLLIGLLTGGHVLLEGVPGVGKTLLVRSLSAALRLTTTRLQFTPDLMPGDVTGSVVFDPADREFVFREGPVFTNVLLADEINRTPPKTQAALLEAMEERQVSADGTTRPLPDPFLVAATQNPIEYEGTYALPEAQLDRFLLKVVLELPDRDAEYEVVRRHAAGFDPRAVGRSDRDGDIDGVQAVIGAPEIADARRAVLAVGARDEVLAYLVDLARATRTSPSVRLGVSPRGSTALLAAAKAYAWLSGYDAITPDHVQAMAPAAWRHRLLLRPEAELEGVTADGILRSVLQQVQVPL